jgi:hypothetical protein
MWYFIAAPMNAVLLALLVFTAAVTQLGLRSWLSPLAKARVY